MRAAVLVALIGVPVAAASAIRADDGSRFAVFTGSTPSDDAIETLLAIPAGARAELIEWELALDKDPLTDAPTTYHLRYAYGRAVPNLPGLAPAAPRAERRGRWRLSRGTPAHPARAVFELEGAVSLLGISDTVVHVLDSNRTLMAGNGGWSYTLSRRQGAEPPVDAALAAADQGDDGRTISPLAIGPSVFGVFEGRTPCQAIARELRAPARPGCWKAKWRVTLLEDPRTYQPTTYKVEGTLHPTRAREGEWRIARGVANDPQATVFELAAAGSEAPLLLMKGDDRVLFFLDHARRPLTGDGRFGYTLDRRADSVRSESDAVVTLRDLARRAGFY